MIMRFCILVLTLCASVSASANDAFGADTEDLLNESDAAAAEVGDVKQEMRQEKARAEKRHEAATKTYNSAVAKRAQVVEQMKQQETEIARLKAEQGRLTAETERISNETVAMQTEIDNSKLQIEQLKQDTLTLTTLRTEKNMALTKVAAERDKVVLDLKDVDMQKQEAEASFNLAKEQEKLATEEMQKLRLEHRQKKARQDAYAAEMNLKKQEAQARLATLQTEKASLNPAATTPEPQTPDAPRGPSTSATTELQVKRKCRIFDKPGKGSTVLGIQSSGTAIAKTREGKSWVAFPMPDGREGFIAKRCLQ